MKNIILVLCLFAVFSSCSKDEQKDQTAQQETEKKENPEQDGHVNLTKGQFETAGIEIGTTTIRDISDVVSANGKIDIPPRNLVSISAPMGGFVRKTELLQGMTVRKGQVLATIENPDFIQIQQDYLETQSRFEYAQLEYKRQTELSRENINAQKILQQANAEVKSQKARLEGLTERLKTAGINLKTLNNGTIVNSASIYSPISGSVTTVNVNLGKYVNPTDVMFEIVDTDHLHVELSVFEQDIPKIKLGQNVHFTVSNNPAKEYTAKVYLINQKINEDRTVRVHCHLTKHDEGLLPENFVKAVIETGANPVAALPEQAIVDFENKSYIFVDKGIAKDSSGSVYAFRMVEVVRGASENGYSEVKFEEGFDGKNAKIVLKGAYALLAKLKNTEEEE